MSPYQGTVQLSVAIIADMRLHPSCLKAATLLWTHTHTHICTHTQTHKHIYSGSMSDLLCVSVIPAIKLEAVVCLAMTDWLRLPSVPCCLQSFIPLQLHCYLLLQLTSTVSTCLNWSYAFSIMEDAYGWRVQRFYFLLTFYFACK